MSELTILIIGIGIGYFWAMWRVDNIRVNGLAIHHHIDARKFVAELRVWAEKSGENPPIIIETEGRTAHGTLRK